MAKLPNMTKPAIDVEATGMLVKELRSLCCAVVALVCTGWLPLAPGQALARQAGALM